MCFLVKISVVSVALERVSSSPYRRVRTPKRLWKKRLAYSSSACYYFSPAWIFMAGKTAERRAGHITQLGFDSLADTSASDGGAVPAGKPAGLAIFGKG